MSRPHLSLFLFFSVIYLPGSSFLQSLPAWTPGVTAPDSLSWPVSLVNWRQRRVSVHPKLHGARPSLWRLGQWQLPPTSISSRGSLRTVVTETHHSSASLGWNTSPHAAEEAHLLPSCWLPGQAVREDGRSGNKLSSLPLFTSFQNNELVFLHLSNCEIPPSHFELMIWVWCVSICCRYNLNWSLSCSIFSLWRPFRLDPRVLHDPGLLWLHLTLLPTVSQSLGSTTSPRRSRSFEWQMTSRGCFLALWSLVWSLFLSLSFGYEIFSFKIKKSQI